MRTLYSPNSLTRKYQALILKYILSNIVVPDYLHAFEPGKSVPALAKQLVGSHTIISLDLKDYFHRITFTKVRLVLANILADPDNSYLRCIKSKPPVKVDQYAFTYPLAKGISLLTHLITYNFFVPQGALTSPKISNLVTASTFGSPLKEYCDNIGARLDIYADDIIISFKDKPQILPRDVIRNARNIIGFYGGFSINIKKTKVMTRKSRQWVCGVVINEKTNLVWSERNKLRGILHSWKAKGLAYTAQGLDFGFFYRNLKGRISWFKQLNEEKGSLMFETLNALYERDKHLIERPLTAA